MREEHLVKKLETTKKIFGKNRTK